MNFSRPHSAAVHDDDTMNRNPADTSSFFDVEDNQQKHNYAFGTWKEKAGRIYASVFRPRSAKRGIVAADTLPSSSSSTSPTDNNTNPSSNPPRRRRYIDVWITKDPPSSASSSSSRSRRGIKQEYRTALKDRVVRKHLTICIVSFILLLSMIPIYSIYASHNKSLNGQTYHIFFLLFLMIFVIIFCHSLARTILLATSIAQHGGCASNGATSFSSFRRIPSVAGPQGYAQPAHPIHVVLARDEEIALEAADSWSEGPGQGEGGNNSTSTTSKPAAPPPAYGLWRNTVRINPNLLYWQRVDNTNTNTNTTITPLPTIHDSNNNDESQNEQHNQHQTTNTNANSITPSTTSTQIRPPSYASEDGVEYVVEAQPRSTVPQYRVAF